MRRSIRGLVLCTLSLAACSSAGTGGPRRSPNIITAEELQGISELHAMGAIQRLRPNWIRPRGAPTVYTTTGGGSLMPALRIDDAPRASLDELTSLPVSDVQEMRFISPSDATTLYGTGYPNGVIEVRTKR